MGEPSVRPSGEFGGEFDGALDGAFEDDARSGLVCFLDAKRVCGPDCMAFSVAPDGGPLLSEEQRRCVLLSAAERLGRHSGLALKAVKDATARAERHRADRARQSQHPEAGSHTKGPGCK